MTALTPPAPIRKMSANSLPQRHTSTTTQRLEERRELVRTTHPHYFTPLATLRTLWLARRRWVRTPLGLLVNSMSRRTWIRVRARLSTLVLTTRKTTTKRRVWRSIRCISMVKRIALNCITNIGRCRTCARVLTLMRLVLKTRTRFLQNRSLLRKKNLRKLALGRYVGALLVITKTFPGHVMNMDPWLVLSWTLALAWWTYIKLDLKRNLGIPLMRRISTNFIPLRNLLMERLLCTTVRLT